MIPERLGTLTSNLDQVVRVFTKSPLYGILDVNAEGKMAVFAEIASAFTGRVRNGGYFV